jgi:hypothetical protein
VPEGSFGSAGTSWFPDAILVRPILIN